MKSWKTFRFGPTRRAIQLKRVTNAQKDVNKTQNQITEALKREGEALRTALEVLQRVKKAQKVDFKVLKIKKSSSKEPHRIHGLFDFF